MRPLARTVAVAVALFSVLAAAAQAAPPSIYADGLDAPRGLTFGPDGALYVAEAGSGGTTTSADLCPELTVPPPVGPVMNGRTARVSRVDRHGVRSTVADGLPSSVTQFGGDYIGMADVAFVRQRLYALLAGGGCSNGERDRNLPNGVIRIRRAGSWSYVANLSEYYMSHPVANPPETADFTPDGVPYDMVAKGGDLYIVEANSGALDRVSVRTGRIERVIDISASLGHSVPTALDARGGAFYVGTLGAFPIVPGAQNVYRITREGTLEVVASGLTAVVGIALDARGRLYALETSAVGPFPTQNAGRLVRLTRAGTWETVADNLNYPTAMVFGPDRALYVSVNGYNVGPETGQVVRVAVDGYRHEG